MAGPLEAEMFRSRSSPSYMQPGPIGLQQYINATPQNHLMNVFAQYPRLAMGNDPAKTRAIFATGARAQQGLRDHGLMEYWPPDETGDHNFPHPAPGNTALEIYDPKIQQDPEQLNGYLFGDLLHGMTNDPNFSLMRQEFAKNFSPQTLAFEAKRGPMDNSRLDAYIRGYLSPAEQNGEFMSAQRANGIYSPRQLQILGHMKNYLGLQQ